MVEQEDVFSLQTATASLRQRIVVATVFFLVLTSTLPSLRVAVGATANSLAGSALMEQLHGESQEKWQSSAPSGDDTGSTAATVKKRSLRQSIGSSPLSCRFRCGSCAPCRAVAVPIQPGWSRPFEYYPEAWRCQCGNKLFFP